MSSEPLGAFKHFNVIKTLEGHPPRTNFNVFRLDGRYNLRIAEVTGRFPWHCHTNGDEGWLILKGGLQIDVEGRDPIIMREFEGTMIPKGHRHSPIALEDGTIVAVFNVNGLEHDFNEEEPETGAFSEADFT